MINMSQYEEVNFFLRQIQELEYNGFDRFRLHGYQKHGEDTKDLPEGNLYTHTIAYELDMLISKAIMFDCYVETQKMIQGTSDEG
jgi:hypothetical protein